MAKLLCPETAAVDKTEIEGILRRDSLFEAVYQRANAG